MEFVRIKNKIQLKKSLHTLVETNPPIIKMEVNELSYLEVEDIAAVREVNLEFSEGKPFCVLLNTEKGYFNVSPEANKLLTSEEFSEKRMAAAFIVNSLATKLAGNFFIKLSKRKSPTKMFTNEGEAVKWLKGFAK